ncbi:tubulin glycylase 3B-like [Teleopsis dalmanni]|uniref:tubulin glycylase 3B-like n=1 Tax=Teleopsis dalmanni TaxID=139649 RepID=UPI0018CE4789|nr:tubulin glycylase 3B-like [Teleopsis dalmanni]
MEKRGPTPQLKNYFNANTVLKLSLLMKNIDNELTEEPVGRLYLERKKKMQQQISLSQMKAQQQLKLIGPPKEVDSVKRAFIYRERVNAACQNRHVFYTDCNTVLSAALQRRGWLGKLAYYEFKPLQNLSNEVLLRYAKPGNDHEKVYISRLLRDSPASFVWHFQYNLNMNISDNAYINHIGRGYNLDFSTKIGLIGCSEQEIWFRNDKGCGMHHPRFYRLGSNASEHVHFVEDYHRTQCRAFIHYLWNNLKNCNLICDEHCGQVPAGIVTFAIENVKRQKAEFEYLSLAGGGNAPLYHGDSWWRYFTTSSNSVIYKKAKIAMSSADLVPKIKVAKKYLENLERKCPDFKWDGCRNLWILKPGYECRGNGIVLKKYLGDILSHANLNSDNNFVVQKYIERPLLIYKTKFDIRIYMLLTIENDILTIWLYNDCYLRFSSQIFNMDVLNQAVHITNNAVQRNYKNYENRDLRLPKNNMWSLSQFNNYLRDDLNSKNVWDEKVLPGIKSNLITTIKTGLEEFNFVNKTFELFGCDFMLDNKYNPILIEVNTNPDLTPSTVVTERLCPMVLKDLLRVVLDLPLNCRAYTGLFQAISHIDCNVNRSRPTNEILEVISGHKLKISKSEQKKHETNSLPTKPKSALANKKTANEKVKNNTTKKPQNTSAGAGPRNPKSKETKKQMTTSKPITSKPSKR